jgi:leucyl aminopeptidase (aminopeptidase T)
LIVHESLKTQPGEKVIIHADPTYFPALTEQVRIELVEAGAVELAVSMVNSGGLEAVRRSHRRREDPALIDMEDRAMTSVFDLADIYIWLPGFWQINPGQTEKILKTWPGRSIHFHWVIDPNDPVEFSLLSKMYEQALFIDYESLDSRQQELIATLRTTSVQITNPAGSDLTFELKDAHFHRGNGQASKEFISSHARDGSARDREVELPAGAIRTVDITNTQGRLVCSDETFFGRQVGTLTYTFSDGRITSVESQHHSDYVQAVWGIQSGDNDRIGEFNLGVSPALTLLPDYPKTVPYFGYGDGVVRISLGDNQESGGDVISSYHHWLFLTDATVKAGGVTLVEHGSLTG